MIRRAMHRCDDDEVKMYSVPWEAGFASSKAEQQIKHRANVVV
jgi:hypothetical protein